MTREEVQRDAVLTTWNYNQGIFLIAPRVGKCRIGLEILKDSDAIKALIAYPDRKIKQSWEDEIEKVGLPCEICFTTFRSLEKHLDEDWDVILIDEIHLLSNANIMALRNARYSVLYGLTGTLSSDTATQLQIMLNLKVIYKYTQEMAIEDGIVSDYRITVIRVPLDNKRYIQYKKKARTEKQQFDAYSHVIRNLQEQRKNTKFLALARMRIIMNSVAKMEMTRKLIKQSAGQRVLVFCGLKDIADQLGIDVEYTGNEGNLERFAKGEGDSLAVIKMGNTGVTFKPLDKVVINYCDSNEENLQQKISRATNLEYVGKVADIYIVCSTEPVERGWLEKALIPFNKEKIKYETII